MGFNISEIVQGSKYKNLMKYVYGWGASIVLLGALFKLQHYPGAGIMLLVGMITEAIIFFLSAFEPIVEEVDWSIVYPELAGMTDDVRKKDKGGVDMVMLESVITSAISKSKRQGLSLHLATALVSLISHNTLRLESKRIS